MLYRSLETKWMHKTNNPNFRLVLKENVQLGVIDNWTPAHKREWCFKNSEMKYWHNQPYQNSGSGLENGYQITGNDPQICINKQTIERNPSSRSEWYGIEKERKQSIHVQTEFTLFCSSSPKFAELCSFLQESFKSTADNISCSFCIIKRTKYSWNKLNIQKF